MPPRRNWCAPSRSSGFVGAMVHGTTEGRFLDHASFDPMLSAAEELDVPIYIHPHIPPEPVRQAYFSDLPTGAGRVLETAGWGWHSETAIHVLRMVVAGTLDRHRAAQADHRPHGRNAADDAGPRRQGVLRSTVDHLERPISRTILDQVWITTSGIFDEPPFLAALLTFGIDRIMFSVDYPYSRGCARPQIPRTDLAVARRHGKAHARQRRCAAQAKGPLSGQTPRRVT